MSNEYTSITNNTEEEICVNVDFFCGITYREYIPTGCTFRSAYVVSVKSKSKTTKLKDIILGSSLLSGTEYLVEKKGPITSVIVSEA